MEAPEAWTARAWNPVPHSENAIHGDEVARAHGFRGGLVPGVVVSAYLLHPAAVAWGREWAERGDAHVVVRSPVYDGEGLRVEVSRGEGRAYEAVLVDERGTECATARVSLSDDGDAGDPPKRRRDPLLFRDTPRPVASPEVMARLREVGLGALPACWDERAEITSYLGDPSGMAPVFRPPSRLANPAFVLGLTNWALAGNVRMSPWLHLETESRHHRAIDWGSELVVESAIADLFEKKGHAFVDVDVGVFDRADDAAVASIRLRAIYRLRAP